MIVGVALGTGLITFIAWHFLGGFTGDVLGAAAVTARMVGLGAFALAVTP
jgi:cobalamin synthase